MNLGQCGKFTAQGHTRKKRFSYNNPLNSWINVFTGILLQLFVLNSKLSGASQESMLSDLQALATALPGCYSNVQQYHKHVQKGLPPHKRHFLIKSEMYRIESPIFNDTLTIYFQDFTKFSTKPFRSGFYSFSLETERNIIRMRTFKLKHGEFGVDAFQNSNKFSLPSDVVYHLLDNHNVTAEDLRTYSACDMFWKRLSERTFVGITGPLCLGALGHDQVRIGVSMTLNNDRLLLTEGWYKLNDGTRITEVKVPYVLQKLKLPEKKKQILLPSEETSEQRDTFKDKNIISDESFETDSLLRSRKLKSKRRQFSLNEDVRSDNRRRNRKGSKARKSDKANKHRVLRNFRQVAAAVTSGYDVYFRVELSACSDPGQVKLSRFSFGGKVENFLFVRQDGLKDKRTDYLYFVTKKTVMGIRGPEIIYRQVTILREGRVKVRVIKVYTDPSQMNQEYAFDCRLYSDLKGYGGVKMALDPRTRVKRVNRFKALASSVDQGRDLRLVADLSRCQGSSNKPAVVVGSRITDYDYVNGGKTVEVYIPFVEKISSAELSTSPITERGFIGQIFKNGDVILTLVNSQSEPGLENKFRLSPAYQCQLSNRNAVDTNDENGHSVKVFHTK